MQFKFVDLAAMPMLFVGTLAIAAPPCPHQPAGMAIHEIIGVDQSDSISAQQLAEWEPAAHAIVLQLCPGDYLQIFGIHNNTLNSKPFFDKAMPEALSANATMAQRIVFKREVFDFRQKADAAIRQAFQQSTAVTATDIFSLFDRVHGVPSHQVHLVIFSDGLHSNAEFNLEKVSLSTCPFGPLIQRLATHHGWRSATLSGASVAFVLPSFRGGKEKSPGPNDRFALQRFYRSLIASLGGTLSSFETQLGGAL